MHPICHSFRACGSCDIPTQGVALGWHNAAPLGRKNSGMLFDAPAESRHHLSFRRLFQFLLSLPFKNDFD